MNERSSLWAACVSSPGDSTARAALADRLEEDGHPDLAKQLRGFSGRQFLIAAAGLDQGSDFVTQLHRSSQPEADAEVHIRDEVDQITESDRSPASMRSGDWSFEELDLETVIFDDRGAHVRFAFTITNGRGRDLSGHALARFETDGLIIEVNQPIREPR